MSYYTLNFQVEGGEISSSLSVVTADSVEYITAEFNFDESWSDLVKTAIFRVGDVVYHVPLDYDSCLVPFEALKEPMMYVSVFGVLGTTRATTLELPIQVQNSGYTVCIPHAPTPDPYNYFLEKVTALKNESVEKAANTLWYHDQTKAILNEVKQSEENIASMEESVTQNAEQTSSLANEVFEKSQYVTNLSESAAQSAKSAKEAEQKTLDKIEVHNSTANYLAHPNIVEIANEAKAIALGKANSLCFTTKAELEDWVSGDFVRADGITVGDIKIGDNLYILELGVPDYWWDGEHIQPLGAEKPNLTDIYKKDEIDARLSNLSFAAVSGQEYENLYLTNSLEAGKIYFVYEEE